MNIRFVSSLTPEDEDRIAPGLVLALGKLLDAVPIAYTLRVETATGKLFQHAHAGQETTDAGFEAMAEAEPPTEREPRNSGVARPRSEVS